MELKETKGVPASEFSLSFVQGMLDRMGMSYFKYGSVVDAYPLKVNAIQSLFIRLLRYLGPEKFTEETKKALEAIKRVESAPHSREHGNTEYLMDAANFAMIEFMHPRHEQAHFIPADADQSPGRVFTNGVLTDAANTVGRENVRRGGSNMRTNGGFYRNEGD